MNKTITNPILTKTEMFVTSKCPRGFGGLMHDLNFKTCLLCPLYISTKECRYKEYVPMITHKVDEDEDDGSGGMPCDIYMWYFPCSKCGEKLLITSGMSCMQKGDYAKCNKCGTTHYFHHWDNTTKKSVFVIPIP